MEEKHSTWQTGFFSIPSPVCSSGSDAEMDKCKRAAYWLSHSFFTFCFLKASICSRNDILLSSYFPPPQQTYHNISSDKRVPEKEIIIICCPLTVNHGFTRQRLCKAWQGQCKSQQSLCHTQGEQMSGWPLFAALGTWLLDVKAFSHGLRSGYSSAAYQKVNRSWGNRSGNNPNFHFLSMFEKSESDRDENNTFLQISHSSEWDNLQCLVDELYTVVLPTTFHPRNSLTFSTKL